MKINNASEASIIVNAAISSHCEFWSKIRATEDYLIRGERPLDEDDLKNAGEEWRNNWNYGRGRSQIEQGVINNTSDVIKSFSFIDIEFEKFNPKKHKKKIHGFLLDKYISDILASSISGALIDTLEEDDRIHTFISSIEYNSYTFGYCPVIRDFSTYLGYPVHIANVAFEDKTKIGQYNTWVVFDQIKADCLYEKYKRNKNRSLIIVEYMGQKMSFSPDGWCMEGLFDILKYKIEALGYKKKDSEEKLQYDCWDDIDNIINNKGITTISSNINNIFIAKVYTVEGSDIVETYVATDAAGYNLNSGSHFGAREFLLYQKVHKNKKYNKFIEIIKEFGVTTESFIHELRGSGKFISEDALRYDTKRNSIEDKLLFSGAPMFSVTNGLVAQKSKIRVCGAFNIIPDDVSLIQNQVRYELRDHIDSLKMDDIQHEKNIFHYNPKLDLSSRPTTDEVNIRGNEVSNQRRSKLPIKLADYSRLFKSILDDLTFGEYEGVNKENQEKFFEYIHLHLLMYGIELTDNDVKEVIKTIKILRLNPANGDVQSIRQAMEIASSSEYRKRLTTMYLLALGFSRKDSWNYVEVEDFGDEVDKAAMEHVQFYTTQEVPVGRNQDQITHLNMHYAKIDRVIKGVAGGEDVVRGFNFVTNALINTKKHLEIISTNPFFSNQLKKFSKIQDFFEGKARQLAQLVENLKQQESDRANQQQQQGQQQGGLPPDVANKLYIDRIKALDKIQRTNELTKNAMDRKRESFELDKQIRQEQAQQGIEISKQYAELKKEIEMLKQSVALANAKQQG